MMLTSRLTKFNYRFKGDSWNSIIVIKSPDSVSVINQNCELLFNEINLNCQFQQQQTTKINLKLLTSIILYLKFTC